MNNENPITKANRRANIHITSRKIQEANSKPIVRINIKDYTDIKIYQSATMAQDDGFSQSAISAVCLNKYKQHKGYNWMFLTDYENLINIYYARRAHKLAEWHVLCDWIMSLPYAKELIAFKNEA